MTQYLLSVHTDDSAPSAPRSDEEMQQSWQRIAGLEEDMRAAGALLLSARLHSADTATVVRAAGGDVVMTDGPFVESKEHIGGFYVIDADDLDTALAWAARVTDCVGAPIEVRPFAGFRLE